MALAYERIQTSGITWLSGWSKRTVVKWGEPGKVLLPGLLRLPRPTFATGLAVALTSIILLLERFAIR